MAGYGTDQGFADWLAVNGYELPPGALAPAVLRQRGSAYIDGLYGARFLGLPTDPLSQERAWPRTGATVHRTAIPSDTIPAAVINASYAAAYHEALNPGGLAVAVTPAQQVKREKVDVLEVEYFAGSGDAVADATPILTAVEGLLAPVLAQPLSTTPVGIWSIG